MYTNYPYNYYQQHQQQQQHQQHQQQQHQQQQPVTGHQHSVPYYQYDTLPQHQQYIQPSNMIEQPNNGMISHQSGCQYMNQDYTYDNSMQAEVSMVCAPPEWAVQAKGESRLEPIGDTALAHNSVDLSSQRWFRIGRSPVSDIPLLHTTSSRNHALIFHHPSGACYIIDCKSIHGTYVDGIRMESYPHPPKKVRKGALIRFGGPGSPTFVLKRFSNAFHSFVRDMDLVAHSLSAPQQSFYSPENTSSPSTQPTLISASSSDEVYSPVNTPSTQSILISESSSEEEEEQITPKKLSVRSHYFRHPQHWIHHVRSRRDYHSKDLDILACIRGDGGGVACIAEKSDAPTAALLLLNTRINALGERGVASTIRRNLLRKVKNRFSTLSSHSLPCTNSIDNQHTGRKRIRDFFCYGTSATTHTEKKYKSILTTTSFPSLRENVTDCSISQAISPSTVIRTTKIRFSEVNESFYPQPITPDDASLEDKL